MSERDRSAGVRGVSGARPHIEKSGVLLRVQGMAWNGDMRGKSRERNGERDGRRPCERMACIAQSKCVTSAMECFKQR